MPTVPGVRHRFIEANGVRFHLAEAGDSTAPPVLLLHGFPQHWFMWRDVFEPLSTIRHVIALDLRGFGWSDAPASAYSSEERVADVLAIMDELGLARADIVGHDWGGWLAFAIAQEHPDRVDHLVAISMMHPWPVQRHLAPTTWRWWVTALFEWPGIGPWMLRNQPAVTEWLLVRDAANRSVWSDSVRRCYSGVASEAPRAKAAQRMHLHLVLSLPRVLLGRDRDRPFDIPTLLLSGDNDALIPPAALALPPHRVDRVGIQIIPGGHFLVDENPADVARAIVAHLGVHATVA